jgi:hypothetical protein
MISERRQSLLPSRRESRNRHFSLVQIRNSSTPSPPLRPDLFGTTREAGAALNLVSGPELLVLFATMKSNPIVQPSALRLLPRITGSASAFKVWAAILLWNLTFVPCNAENYVPPITYWLALSLSPGGGTSLRSAIGFDGRGRLGETRLRAISPGLEYYRRSKMATS